ncbi:MAG: Holliday junction resolvase RuvX [Sedimentisphaerales bacterium]|nr:Holliday junction resolvase RuvX [Sedimentisphaerales bacterium]
MRYLAIDLGEKRTGLAICDAEEVVASPLCLIEDQSSLLAQIKKIIHDEQVGGVVVGLPLNMDDTEGPKAKQIRAFAKELGDNVELPIYFQDERLTSFNAEKKLAGEYTRKKKKKRIDAIAAAGILQAFLEEKGI